MKLGLNILSAKSANAKHHQPHSHLYWRLKIIALTGLMIMGCGAGNGQFHQQRVLTGRFAEQEIEVDNQTRYFTAVQPDSYETGKPAVVLLHGGTQSMRKVLGRNTTTKRWLELAERDGFLLLVPNGVNFRGNDAYGDRQSWNDLRPGRDRRRSRADDVAFIKAVVDWATQEQGIDRSRVYVTGASNGGMMALRLLVELPEYFAAAAVFSASLPQNEIPYPAQGTPIMIMNGTDDPLVPWEGGTVSQGADPVRSIEATVDYWIRINGANRSAAAKNTLSNNSSTDGCKITETSYPTPGSQLPVVLFYRVEGGGHSIPAIDPPRYPPAIQQRIGRQCQDVNGVDLAWEFMKNF